MDKATVIALAREAGLKKEDYWVWHIDPLERFANLIHDHLTYSSIHSCHSGCTRPACVAVREAVLAEREACAKVCEGINDGTPYNLAAECAAAIRSRT